MILQEAGGNQAVVREGYQLLLRNILIQQITKDGFQNLRVGKSFSGR